MATDIRIDQVLTTIARGYSNAEFIGDKLFPVVQVEFESGKIPLFGKEAFRVYDDKRARLALSNEIQRGEVTTTDYRTVEHDLMEKLDYLDDTQMVLNQEIRATEAVMDGILLGREVAAANLAFDAANYGANTDELTDDYLDDPDVDPIAFLKNEVNSVIRDKIMKKPNIQVWGYTVYQKLISHPKIMDYLPGLNAKILTLDFIRQLLELDAIYVGEARKIVTEGADPVDVWGNGIVAAYVKPAQGYTRTPYEPCFGYTLELKGNPWSDKGDTEQKKVRWVRTTDNYDIKIVGAESGYFLKNPIGYTEE